MNCPKYLAAVLLFVAVVSARAQATPEISFCPAGVQGDGFIDWSKLPAAPAPPYSVTPVVTVILPVTGVSGLTATVTIQGFPRVANRPIYSALNAADLFVSTIGGTPVTITFSQPVQGFRVVFRSYGRSTHGFHMSANDVYGNTTSVTPPPPAQVDTEGFEFPFDELAAAPLQIRSTSANLTSVAFGFDGDVQENFSFDLINLRVESGSGPDLAKQVPSNGLKAWYRSDRSGLTTPQPGISTVSTWPDQSGNGNDATAAGNASNLVLDGAHCAPVLSFGGTQRFNLNVPVSGWTEMTIVLAAQSYADNPNEGPAIFWNSSVPEGTTLLSPMQTAVNYRFGTGQPGNLLTYVRPANADGDFTITTAIHRQTADDLFVDGVRVQRTDRRIPALASGLISGTIGGSPIIGFVGNIGEVLIYDRALTTRERELIEQYLRAKYGSR